MNKYNRSKHIEAIALIDKATFEISRLICEGRASEVLELLADCQDVAVALGGHIEKLYGLQTKTVAVLEEYCNALYNVSVSMDETSLMALEEVIELVQATYEMEFSEKKEIVFMPYKASMWDSFESVWKAAIEDEDCEVYVVPIPYYDKDEKGAFSEFHWEGNQFPEYVSITNYEQYDLELRKPDVIYIHNPYDDYNYVTSVAPKYYSMELKKYTDLLVYIPYFVVDEDEDIKKVEHYACMPAVINADIVIVQSECVKKIYVKTLANKIDGISRAVWEDKILGMGSPKCDAVQRNYKKIKDIPKEWKDMIGDKKVVLYNTHLSLLMADKYIYFLKKLREVINLFRNRDDVILLWRPHPLMIPTAKAMNPIALEEYMSIVEEYCENKYGIYDDTPNMNLAIAISNAYYGSTSSMLPLYKITGKPIMTHGIKMDTEI